MTKVGIALIALSLSELLSQPALAGDIPSPAGSTAPAMRAATAAPVAQPTIAISALTDAQQKDPKAALAAMRKVVGGEKWQKFGGLFVTGFAQIQGQSLAFTSAADLRSGFNRTIILLPHNAGMYEFGVDKDGGWSAVSGKIRAFAVTPENLVTARYVGRFGIFDATQVVALKEVGTDPNIGDRITVTPTGGVPFLAIVKPATALLSAIQLANGQVNVYADYRSVAGVLFPYRVMQGADVKAMSIFQASSVEPMVAAPDVSAVTRPSLAADTSGGSPQPASTVAPK